MNKLRLTEKNIIYTRIKEIENSISRSQKTIDRLKTQDNTEFNRTQISKNEKLILDNSLEIEKLKQRLIDLSNGGLDEQLKNVSTETDKICKEQQIVIDKKLKDKNEKKIKDKVNLDKEYNIFRKREGISDYGIIKETDRYFKNCQSIPDYMIANLKDMPSNKGYIWKGIHCYGIKPKENNNICTMFEKCWGGILKIHETTKTTYKVYEKVGKEQKKLIIDEVRNPIKC